MQRRDDEGAQQLPVQPQELRRRRCLPRLGRQRCSSRKEEAGGHQAASVMAKGSVCQRKQQTFLGYRPVLQQQAGRKRQGATRGHQCWPAYRGHPPTLHRFLRSHTRPQGSSPTERFCQLGFPCKASTRLTASCCWRAHPQNPRAVPQQPLPRKDDAATAAAAAAAPVAPGQAYKLEALDPSLAGRAGENPGFPADDARRRRWATRAWPGCKLCRQQCTAGHGTGGLLYHFISLGCRWSRWLHLPATFSAHITVGKRRPGCTLHCSTAAGQATCCVRRAACGESAQLSQASA